MESTRRYDYSSLIRSLEYLGAGKAGGGFFESDKGQAGGGGLGVDQAIEEAGFGGGKSLAC